MSFLLLEAARIENCDEMEDYRRVIAVLTIHQLLQPQLHNVLMVLPVVDQPQGQRLDGWKKRKGNEFLLRDGKQSITHSAGSDLGRRASWSVQTR